MTLTRKPTPQPLPIVIVGAPEARNHSFTVRLTEDEANRLQALAVSKSDAKKKWTPEECLVRMVQTCQPGGSGWSHPTEGKKSP